MTNLATFLLLAIASIASPAPKQAPVGAVAVSLPDGLSLSMPEIRSKPMPAGVVATGQIDIETVVSAAGAVAHTRVARSTDPTGALDRACVEALQQWRFTPSMNNGRPLPSLVLLRFSAARTARTGGAGPPAVDVQLTTVEYAPGPEEWSPAPSGQAPMAVTSLPGGVRGVQPPAVLREVKPNYTVEAMRAKLVGSVELTVVVAPDGTVAAAKVAKSLDATHGLDTAALIAARYWLFKPGTTNGVAVFSTATLILEFRLR
jgi:TonB family protein